MWFSRDRRTAWSGLEQGFRIPDWGSSGWTETVNSRINSVLLLHQHRTIMLGQPYSDCTNNTKLRWFKTYTKKVRLIQRYQYPKHVTEIWIQSSTSFWHFSELPIWVYDWCNFQLLQVSSALFAAVRSKYWVSCKTSKDFWKNINDLEFLCVNTVNM